MIKYNTSGVMLWENILDVQVTNSRYEETLYVHLKYEIFISRYSSN